MKKILFLLFITFISLFLFGERVYLSDETVLEGSIISLNDGMYILKSDDGLIKIPKELIVKIEFLRERYEYLFDITNLYKEWKIGGRRENGSLIYVDKIDNEEWLRIHKDGYTENNLYKDFELNYSNNTKVFFSSEIMGFTTKSASSNEMEYAIAGIIFVLLDENKNEINKIAYAWGSEAYPFNKHDWINRLYASVYKPFELKFDVKNFVGEKEAKYLRVILWTYCSSDNKNISADLWIKNLKLIMTNKNN
ncbi:hypothetical protein [Marinitoga litoralis]|jgi:hypothetical protein|uniref:hypothetical protein n=1 Tax=Marinitoga litoralis TaxID=570855 RepID=UPI001961E6B4|nr:hypothetical protein [Marinitoga litoralis]MBM7559829.1 hypothetical protein [Marinitoga litoralis]